MITVEIGNITRLKGLFAIVNAANSKLRAGSGVCGAIHEAAGPELALACAEVAPCATGAAAITPAFLLSRDDGPKFIIHAVGPIYLDYLEARSAELLRDTYQSIFRLCRAHSIRSVAIPAISTGIYGYPVEAATKIAVNEAISAQSTYPMEITFSVFAENHAVYERALNSVAGGKIANELRKVCP